MERSTLACSPVFTSNNRRRSSSVQKVLQHVTSPPPDHRLGAGHFHQIDGNVVDTPLSPLEEPKNDLKRAVMPWEEASRGFWDDLYTMRWMRHPASSFRIIVIFMMSWLSYEILRSPLHLPSTNPFTRFFVISYPLSRQSDEKVTRYGKGLQDIPFLLFYIVVFSFIRQFLTVYLIKPYAEWLGLRGTKAQRFVDQGYAVFYWGTASIVGLIVMSKQPTWWYKTEEFWRGYPHWRMDPTVKAYYLLQFAYWLQQMLILTLHIEKPRSDFYELCVHHCVTLWLVGWSYAINATMIGTTVFVSMDIPDTFLGISKCINYTKYQRTSEVSFGIFLCVWTYLRHWENMRILYSVYYEYDEIVPVSARRWSPKDEVYLTSWVKWQVFAPILLLQLLNLFWYYLIWRIVFRLLLTGKTNDMREDGDDDQKED